MKTIHYVEIVGDGHHADFDRVFMAVFKDIDASVHMVRHPWLVAFAKAPLFYSMFDTRPHQTTSALLLAALRSLFGLKTVGLVFRPSACFIQGSIKAAIRRKLFQFTSHLPHVSLLSIVPFDVYPQASIVATNWIYDPQLWDLYYLPAAPLDDGAELKTLLQDKAKGRRLVVALGGQNRSKGFDAFCDLWLASSSLRGSHLFVSAGKVAEASREKAAQFEASGGLLINRRIEDAELFYLYHNAAMIWSCYAPDYNQSSGIHGRAVQMGVPVIVRRGSFLETLGAQLAHETLALPFDKASEAATLLVEWKNSGAAASPPTHPRERSLAVLKEAIGFRSPE